MKKIILTILVLLSFQCGYSQYENLTIIPSKIHAGSKLHFSYSGKLAKKGTTVWIEVFNIHGSIRKPYDFECVDNKLEGTFIVPDSTVYVLFSFSNGKENDPSPETSPGYGFLIYENDRPVKGAFLNQGSSYCREFCPTIDAEKALKLIKKEFNINPDLKERYIGDYLWALSKTKNGSTKSKLMAQQIFEKDMANDKDKRLPLLIHFISEGNLQTKDSLLHEVEKKFPNGRINFQKQFAELTDIENPKVKLQKYHSLLHDFPEKCKSKQVELNKILTGIYGEMNEFDKFEKQLLQVDDDKYQAIQYNEIAWNLSIAGTNLQQAKKYSEKALLKLDEITSENSLRIKNQKKEHYDIVRAEYLDTYAYILSKQGNKTQALELQKKAMDLSKGQNREINKRMLQYLIDNNQMKEVIDYYDRMLILEQSDFKIDSLHQVAYYALYGTNNGSKKAKMKVVDTLKFAADFSLKTIDGETVQLSDLKGKIVILDFWATWCVPCIASFSGMQKAIDALKNNPDICFLFINTYQNESNSIRVDKINKLLKYKNVNFTVLLDEKENNVFKTSEQFKVKAIPTKIIIDKNGRIRSTLVGNKNSDNDLVEELVNIIKSIEND